MIIASPHFLAANEDVNVDQRVIDVSRSQGKASDEPMARPKSGSFIMGRTGSFSSKKQNSQKKQQEHEEKEREKEREKEQNLRDKADKVLAQQLKNVSLLEIWKS